MPQPMNPADLPKHPSEARWWRVTHTWYIQASDRATAATAAKQEPPYDVTIKPLGAVPEGVVIYPET